MAETLPEAMERGDVRAEPPGRYVLLNVNNVNEPVVLNSNHVNLWRQLAAVPEEARPANPPAGDDDRVAIAVESAGSGSRRRSPSSRPGRRVR